MTECVLESNEKLTKSQQRRVRKKNSKLRRRQESLIIKHEDSDSREYPSELENIPDFELKGAFERFINIFDKEDSRTGIKDDKSSKNPLISQTLNELPMKARAAAMLQDEHDRDDHDEEPKIGKKQLKRMNRMSTAQLKINVERPELVETWDYCSKDPLLLLEMKSMRNTVPVPRHWCAKRKYLQGKRGFEKPPFKLPEFIAKTGIMDMRQTVQDKETDKSLKSKMREKIRPKIGHVDIDYNKLHDAFFKYQTKPPLTIHGDIYYEGKEFEVKLKEKKPGQLSDDCRTALGLPTGANSDKYPPPWLIAMQRYGPPPSYPNLKIPGLNAPIPYGCSFGYHANGWGKPPVDETGRPIYGDVFMDNLPIPPPPSDDEYEGDELNKYWGEIESEDDDDEDDDDNGDRDDDDDEDHGNDDDHDGGMFTPAEGLVTPSGVSSVGQGLMTPQSIELRKKTIEDDLASVPPPPPLTTGERPLFTVIPQVKAEIGGALMGSDKLYQIPETDSRGHPIRKRAPVSIATTPYGTAPASSGQRSAVPDVPAEPKAKKHKEFKF